MRAEEHNQQQIELRQRELIVERLIEEIQIANEEMLRCQQIKKDAVTRLREIVGHKDDSSKTYSEGTRKFRLAHYSAFEPTSSFLAGDVFLDPHFNPIEAKTVFKVNKSAYLEFMATSPLTIRNQLALSVKSPERSASITILV